MNLVKTLVAARDFAIRAHGSQKYGEHPYVVHLDEVANIALGAAMDPKSRHSILFPDVVTIAYLHDVLEDTETSEKKIEESFGNPVLLCSLALTDPKGKNRRERKAALNERLVALDPDTFLGCMVLVTKACDRLANARRSAGIEGGASDQGLLKMYRAESAEFRKAVHRPGLCDGVWEELDRVLPPL